MLEMSTEALAIVQRSYTMQVRVESWLDGVLLADGIPVATGNEDRDRSLTVPERITLTVPRRDRGTDWDPTDPDHPLAAYGQRLRIDVGIGIGRGRTEWINRGWFLVTGSGADGDTVSVQVEGLLALIEEARFVAPYQPSGTLASTVRSLVEPAVTVEFDGLLTDRSVPVGMQWDEDRMAALSEVLDAWPAVPRVTEDGYLLIEPLDDSGDPVLSLTDGVGGTVVRWQANSSRDGAFNAVVARGEDSSGNPIQGVVYDRDSASPLRYDGPFSPLAVPYTFSSPLLTTVTQCRTAAAATLQRLRRAASRMLAVTMVPHPGLMIGDIVSVTGAGLTDASCVIETLGMPYQPGEMTLTLRVLNG